MLRTYPCFPDLWVVVKHDFIQILQVLNSKLESRKTYGRRVLFPISAIFTGNVQ